jgi:hypothetical protein
MNGHMNVKNRKNCVVYFIHSGNNVKLSLSMERRHIGVVEMYIHTFLTSASDVGSWYSLLDSPKQLWFFEVESFHTGIRTDGHHNANNFLSQFCLNPPKSKRDCE